MKFISKSEDGIVKIEASPEEKRDLIKFLHHFFIDEIMPISPGREEKRPLINQHTEACISFNDDVEDIISKIEAQITGPILKLDRKDFKDLDTLVFCVNSQADIDASGFPKKTYNEIKNLTDDVTDNVFSFQK
jgi:hypothetical protein